MTTIVHLLMKSQQLTSLTIEMRICIVVADSLQEGHQSLMYQSCLLPEEPEFSSNGGETKRSTLMDLPKKNLNEDRNQQILEMSVIMELVIQV